MPPYDSPNAELGSFRGPRLHRCVASDHSQRGRIALVRDGVQP